MYLGHLKEKYGVFVPHLTSKQLEDVDPMAKKLFQTVFAEQLQYPDKICCTHSEGKKLLDQELLKGIRCTFIVDIVIVYS